MGASKLIDSHVSSAQCDKAVSALVGHATKIAKRKEEHELLPGKEENLWIVVSVKKVTPEKKLKAHKMFALWLFSISPCSRFVVVP